MPPNSKTIGVIDLTGEDEDDPWSASRTYRASQTKGDAKQPNASQRSSDDFVRRQTNLSSPSRAKKKSEGNQRKSIGTDSPHRPHFTSSSQTPHSQSRKGREPDTNGSSFSREIKPSSQRAGQQAITIDSESEDESRGRKRRPPPTEFVTPRDYEPSGSTNASKSNASLLGLFTGSSAKRRKRSSDREIFLLESSPPKKFKSSQRDSRKGNLLSTQNGSHDNDQNDSRTPIAGLVRREFPKGARGEVNLIFPQRSKPERVSLDKGDHFESIVTQRSNSGLSSGDPVNTDPTSARKRDQTSITLREQRTPGRGTKVAEEVTVASANTSQISPSNPSYEGNRKDVTSKNDIPSIRVPNGTPGTFQSQSSVFQEDRNRSNRSPNTSSQRQEHHEQVDSRSPFEKHGVKRGATSTTSPSTLSRKGAPKDQEDGSPNRGSAGDVSRASRKNNEGTKAAARQEREDPTPRSVTKPKDMNGKIIEINVESVDDDWSDGNNQGVASPSYPSSKHAASDDAVLLDQSQRRDDPTVDSPRRQPNRIPIVAKESVDSVVSLESSSIRTSNDAKDADSQLRLEAMQNDVDHASKESEAVFAPPKISASAVKTSPMYSNLPLANRVEKVLGKYLEELRGDNEYWTSVSMRRARLAKDDENVQGNPFIEVSEQASPDLTSFARLKPLKLLPHKKGSLTQSDSDVWGIQRMSNDGKSQAHAEFSAAYATIASDKEDVPDYAHYVSIKNNILAPNVIYLHCWPYFSDDFDCSKALNLHNSYKSDFMEREGKLLLLLKAQKYESYIESALQEVDCSWADVLRFLLADNPDVGSDLDARKACQNRSQYCQEDFSRKSERWMNVLEQLPRSTPEKLGRAAVLCENFQKMAKFSLWQIARRSDFAKIVDEEEGAISANAKVDDDALTCRICLRFNCPYHGQFKHRDDDSDSESDAGSVISVDTVVATDIIHPLKTNYQSRIAFHSDRQATPIASDVAPVHNHKRKKDANYWNNYNHKPEDRGPFYPCHHPGTSCENAQCRCFKRNIPCEKICSCPSSCPRKFQGCACGSRKGKLVCLEDPDCACWQHGRECDPDLCGPCGVCDVVDPLNKYNDGILVGRCRNASIQRGVPKLTLLGDSGVHGLGLYACENIKTNEFVGEYKGEIITKKEADRRGAVYEHQKLSYLFSLNKSQEIDSTYFGNKPRFINHAHGDKANLYPRIIMVNTVHRIGLYAGKDILAGKELLFDYGPYFPNEQLQGKKSKKSAATPESKKSAPHVRNANLVKSFYDVEESEDEDGILRAKAVSYTSVGGKRKTQTRKPRGGARNGVGRKADGQRAADQEFSRASLPAKNVGQGAGERLAAFNISEDFPSEAMEPDVDGGAEDDEAFEPEGSDSDDESEASEERSDESAKSDSDDEGGPARAPMRRAGVRTRMLRRA